MMDTSSFERSAIWDLLETKGELKNHGSQIEFTLTLRLDFP